VTLQEVHTPAQFTIEPGETCLTALMDTAKKRPHGVMFTRPANYEWVNVTGKEFIDEVFEVAQGLIALGVQQGDRVALISATRYEWSLLDFAIWAAGAASVPVYPSSSASQVRWIIEDENLLGLSAKPRLRVEFLEGLTVAVREGDETDEDNHWSAILPAGVDSYEGIGRAGAAGDHGNTGLARSLAVSLCHIGSAAFLAGHDRFYR